VKNLDGKNPNFLPFMRGMLLLQFLGLFVIPVLLFAYFSDPKPFQYLGLRQPSNTIYWVLGAGALLLAIPLVEYTGLLNRKINFGSLQQWVKSSEDEAAEQIKFMLGKHTVGELIKNIFFIAFFAGVGEELFFRGILQRLFIRAFKNPWAGIIVTAILFSALHVQFFGFIPRVLLGTLLGAIYWYSGSLLVAIAAHFFYDAFFITLAYFQPKIVESADASMFENQSSLLVMALVSVGIVGAIIWLMKKYSTASYAEVYKHDHPTYNHQDFTF
jgi:membrane protease YdiL (CAAX protease family)